MAYSRGSQETRDYFIGDWDWIKFTTDPLGTPTEYLLGHFTEGSLEISRENYEHQNSTFPRTVDFTAVVNVGLTFSGNFSELSLTNLALAAGQDPSDVTDGYIYPATSCTDTNLYGNLLANRIQCGSAFNNMIEVMLWKARAGNTLTIGGGEEVIEVPLEFIAQDDRGGTYGGSNSAPLGYIYHTNTTSV